MLTRGLNQSNVSYGLRVSTLFSGVMNFALHTPRYFMWTDAAAHWPLVHISYVQVQDDEGVMSPKMYLDWQSAADEANYRPWRRLRHYRHAYSRGY